MKAILVSAFSRFPDSCGTHRDQNRHTQPRGVIHNQLGLNHRIYLEVSTFVGDGIPQAARSTSAVCPSMSWHTTRADTVGSPDPFTLNELLQGFRQQ